MKLKFAVSGSVLNEVESDQTNGVKKRSAIATSRR